MRITWLVVLLLLSGFAHGDEARTQWCVKKTAYMERFLADAQKWDDADTYSRREIEIEQSRVNPTDRPAYRALAQLAWAYHAAKTSPNVFYRECLAASPTGVIGDQ